MVGVTIEGAERLAALANRLIEAGTSGALSRRVLWALREAADPIVQDTRRHALGALPRRGGLALVVSQQPMTVVAAATGRWKGVRIVARPTSGRGGVRDPAAINRGRVRHLAWGHPRKDGEPIIQLVQAGWFTVPMAAGGDEARTRILGVIDDMIAELQA